jgi:hypothetical protein
VWESVSPAEALTARLAGVDVAVRRVLGEEWAGSAEAAEAASLAATAAAAVDVPGRPLAAANAGLPLPEQPHLALWQALTTLREHRGDGHTVALVQRGISGLGANVLAVAAGRTDREWLLKARGWSEQEWDAAAAELTDRGWLAGDQLTAEGLAAVAAVEADTDRLALGPARRSATSVATGSPRCWHRCVAPSSPPGTGRPATRSAPPTPREGHYRTCARSRAR